MKSQRVKVAKDRRSQIASEGHRRCERVNAGRDRLLAGLPIVIVKGGVVQTIQPGSLEAEEIIRRG